MVKMQAGGSVGMGQAAPSGPMGIAAPSTQEQPGRELGPRVGYKRGGKVKKNAK